MKPRQGCQLIFNSFSQTNMKDWKFLKFFRNNAITKIIIDPFELKLKHKRFYKFIRLSKVFMKHPEIEKDFNFHNVKSKYLDTAILLLTLTAENMSS